MITDLAMAMALRWSPKLVSEPQLPLL